MKPDVFVYQAEWLVHKMGHETRVDDPQLYLEMMQGTTLVRNHWPKAAKRNITIKFTDKAWAGAYVAEDLILIPHWGKTDFTIIHEFAHFCAPPKADRNQDHRSEWIDCELVLVKRFMGKDAHYSMLHAYKAVGKL